MSVLSLRLRRLILVTAGLCSPLWTCSAFGLETVTRRGGKSVSGDVSEISKTEVVVKVKTPKEETVSIPANEVLNIAWSGEAAEAGVARSDDNAGRYQKAIEGYQKSLQTGKSTNPNAKIDLEYGITRATARQALADPPQIDASIKQLEAFRGQEHYRHFEAVQLLGNLYLAKQDYARAAAAFEAYGKAPWKEYRLASKISLARVKLAEKNLDEALSLYESVLADSTEGTGETAQKQEASLGKSRVLLAQQKPADALQLLNSVIAAADPDEVTLHAEAFLRQGDCLRELGKDKDAVLAYLRVDLLFSAAKPQHAESLYQLAKLWAKVGRPERAEEARDRLLAEYPNSEWAGRMKSTAG